MSRETIDAAGDARTANNAMRHQYRVLSDEEKAAMTALKDAGAAFLEAVDATAELVGEGRELAIARTRIEEAVMWSVKAVTK